jgi:4-hydroxythreonine-4-phosphate dehydrogenase
MKPLAISLGDPAGIGAEVVLSALASLPPDLPVWLFGDWHFAACALPSSVALQFERRSAIPARDERVQRVFIDLAMSAGEPLQWGTIDARYGAVALASIDAAVDAIEQDLCSALVTAPIQKQSIAAAGAKVPGHTELLAARAGLSRYGHDFAMYFASPTLRTVLLSVHEPLRRALDMVDETTIVALAHLMTREHLRIHGTSPRIAVAGVNPHAGDGGMFGAEEEIIARAVATARNEGLQVSGPHPADTVFLAASRGSYDVVMAMYHDQGLIPIKTTEFERSVNVTIGLPYLRASVDHGTAFDIAGKQRADATPMRYAIEWTAEHAGRFAR